MVPWNAVVQMALALSRSPLVKSLVLSLVPDLTNPRIVSKLSNTTVIRSLARAAVRLKLGTDNAIKTNPELHKYTQVIKPGAAQYIKGTILRKIKQEYIKIGKK